MLAESELGRCLEPRDGSAELDLHAALGVGDVVYLCLDSDRYALASQMLGAAIVSDFVSLTGELQGRAIRALVMIDEFAAVAAGEFSRVLFALALGMPQRPARHAGCRGPLSRTSVDGEARWSSTKRNHIGTTATFAPQRLVEPEK